VDAIVLTALPQGIRVRLRAPSGQIFDQTHPSMTYTLGTRIGYYRFALPVPGPFAAEGPGGWELLLDWKKAPRSFDHGAVGVSGKAVRYEALVHARSDLAMTATVSQNRLTPGATVTARVRLSQYEVIPVNDARVVARVRFPDGATPVIALAPRGDGVFETDFTAPMAGVYTIRITAEGRTLRGFRFTREAVRTAMAWQGGDAPPPTKHDDGWCGALQCLLGSNAVDLETLKRLGIHPDRFLKCCQDEERIPQARNTKAGAKARARRR
jgi:hypothetical protein